MKRMGIISVLLAVFLLLGCASGPQAAAQVPAETYACKLLNYYRLYQTDAQRQIHRQLELMSLSDPVQAEAWEKIMDIWQYVDQDLELCYDVLPDGLPQDDSLAIVIMGFALNSDGSIRPELEKRLQVGLACAEKYPNATIILTGGPTAWDEFTTEAGQMAKWLLEHGLDDDRLIIENRSLSTAHNALYVYDILTRDHPEIESLAVVTSNYHIPRSFLDFATVSHYYSTVSGKPEIRVVAHACSDPGYNTQESLTSHAADIAAIVGLNMVYQRSTALYAGS